MVTPRLNSCPLVLAAALAAVLASPAAALAEGETVYVVDNSSVDALRSDLTAVSSAVGSVSSTLTTYYGLLNDDIDGAAAAISSLADAGAAQDAQIATIAEDVSGNADTLAVINDHLLRQDATLESVSAAVSAEPDAPTKMEFADVMALVPDDAPTELVAYMSYPFIWGMAAGIVAYLISLAISAVYRLMGLR